MALVIIETKEVIEDGVTYIITTYSNGTVVKTAKPSEIEPVEPEAPEPTQLDRIENNLALLTEDTAEYKAFYEAAKEILPEGSDA